MWKAAVSLGVSDSKGFHRGSWVLAKVSEGLEEECRPGAQGGFLEHHGGCYQLDFIGQHIAATQGSEAAAITAIASQPKKLKKKTMKHLKCD